MRLKNKIHIKGYSRKLNQKSRNNNENKTSFESQIRKLLTFQNKDDKDTVIESLGLEPEEKLADQNEIVAYFQHINELRK